MTAPGERRAARRYRAFISYSRANDRALAARLHEAVETCDKPLLKTRTIRLFRDDASLSAEPRLWVSLEAALDQSDHLILLASPESAKSQWVHREVEYWCETRSPLDIVIVVTSGVVKWDPRLLDFDWTATTALPEVLKGKYTEVPQWIDLQPVNAHRQALADQFEHGVLNVVCRLTGRTPDDIRGSVNRRHRRTVRLVLAALLGFVLLSVTATTAGLIAYNQRSEAVAKGKVAIEERDRADRQAAVAEKERARAEAQAALAQQERDRADTEASIARDERDRAEAQATLATSRYLTIEAARIADAQFDLALLLRIAAANLADSIDARRGVAEMIEANPRIAGFLHGHSVNVDGLAFSSDGRILVSAAQDGTVITWDVSSSKRAIISSTQLAGESFGGLALSPDNRTAAIAVTDGEVVLLSVPSLAQLGALRSGTKSRIWSLAFSPDGHLLAAGNDDGLIQLWDVVSEQLIGPGMPARSGGPAVGVAFSPDGKLLASARFVTGIGVEVDSLVVWDVASQKAIRELSGHTTAAAAVTFSPDGRTLASGGLDGETLLWDTGDWYLVRSLLAGRDAPVGPLLFGRNRALVSSSVDTVTIWDLESGQPDGLPIKGQAGGISSMTLAPNGDQLAVGGSDGRITLWTLTAQHHLATILLTSGQGWRTAILGEHGMFFAGLQSDNRVLVWDLARREKVREWTLPGNPDTVRINSTGAVLLVQDTTGTIGLWDVESSQQVGEIPRSENTLLSWSVDPSARIAAIGGLDGRITLWNIYTRKEQQTLTVPNGLEVFALRFDPGASLLAAETFDSHIWIWQLSSGRLGWDIEAQGEPVATALAFSADGGKLVVGRADGSADVFVLGDTPGRVTTLRGLTSFLNAVTVSMDGDLVAAAADNGAILVWDLASGQSLVPGLKDDGSAIEAIEFAPGSRELVSAGLNGRVLQWTLSFEEWRTTACSIAGRDLSTSEWSAYFGERPFRQTCPPF